MKNFLRTIALLLCAVLMFSVFAACEDVSTNVNESSVATESGSANSDAKDENSFDDAKGFYGYTGIPEGTDFGGREVSVLTLASYQIQPE
ncbi:MAG: hypothetical protein IKU30_05495, partial [Clostridia bacterium]|nr:hypothetical protein [Clostridia bacterium]